MGIRQSETDNTYIYPTKTNVNLYLILQNTTEELRLCHCCIHENNSE